MGDQKLRHSNTINTELTNDLHFLTLELIHLLDLVQETLSPVDPNRLEKVRKRIDYIENLESRIKTLSYDAVFKLKSKHKPLILNYRALISITGNLAKIGDFLVQAANQVVYVQNPKEFSDFDLNPFYECIKTQLNKVHVAFSEVDTEIANQLCESEEKLDELYLEQFNFIQENISNKNKGSDMMTLLFIVRYFERIGDSFLNIGEKILNISIGDAVSMKHYRRIEQAVKDISGNKEGVSYEFKPFLFSRSGCKVGRLLLLDPDKEKKQTLFYKQGDTDKIKEEIDGIELWGHKYPGVVPSIKWEFVDGEDSTLIVNYISGENLLNIVLGNTKNDQVKKVSKVLIDRLAEVWALHTREGVKKSKMMKQVIQRKDAIINVHDDFFEEFTIGKNKEKISFDNIIKESKVLERKVSVPFKVLCHGDFNLDNILYNEQTSTIHFVDVHRSGFKDYAQDVSVFIVSCLRIKLEDPSVKEKINIVCREIFEFAKKFSKNKEDDYFEARFAFGLLRSFVTSTRFVSDDEWYQKMRMKALIVFEALKKNRKDLKDLNFDLKEILE